MGAKFLTDVFSSKVVAFTTRVKVCRVCQFARRQGREIWYHDCSATHAADVAVVARRTKRKK